MMELETLIRTRVAHQLGLLNSKNMTLADILEKSLWIYGEYGITSRLGNSMRSALRRLDDETTVKVPVGRAYRIMFRNTLSYLVRGYQEPVSDTELVEAVPENGIARRALAEALGMSVRKLNYRIRKEQNNWQVVKHEDTIYTMDDFLSQPPSTIKESILHLLQLYPYCNVAQLELFTGLDRMELAGPLAELSADDKIIRGLTRVEAPDEIFCLPGQQVVDGELEIPEFVLEKRDALVEMIMEERYFTHQGADYWIFINGIPQAEFDLEKDGSTYTVKNLHRFVTTNFELADILDQIETWGRSQSIRVTTDSVDDPQTTMIKEFTQILLNRGYQLQQKRLVLDRYDKVQSASSGDNEEEEESSVPDVITWQLIGPWIKNRQFLQYSGTVAELVYQLGQLDEIYSIAYRLESHPNRLRFDNVVYIPGINHRMGFVHKDMVEDIIRGWPKQVKFSFIDKKIMGVLQTAKTTDEIIQAIAESPMTIKQRLRYLEQSRVIRKLLPGGLSMDDCLWVLFEEELDDYSKPVGGKRAMASVGTFLIKALETNPPLAKSQLARFLGMTNKEIEPLLNQYLRTNKIIEGYFIQGMSEIQYTLPEILDTLQPGEIDWEEESATNRVDLLPLSDPFAMIHLPPLVLEDPTIQPTQRYDDLAEQYMIAWDGQPVGYVIKQHTSQQLLDYELHLKITSSMITTPIIAGTLQKLVALFRTWYGDEGKISTINDIEASDRKWKDIHFMIESIGIAMD